MRRTARTLGTAVLAAVALAAGGAAAADDVGACRDDPRFRALDFWVGEWEVRVGDRVVGSNSIAPVLDGCAIEERWRAAGGGEGRSLFYVPPAGSGLRQVWVTARALARGGVKEKDLVSGFEGPGVRFEGAVATPEGAGYRDRTTLVPLPDGTVRQTIAVSTDGGATWTTTFDAVYVRRGPGEGAEAQPLSRSAHEPQRP